MVTQAIRKLLAEPRAPDQPGRGWPEWLLVGVLVPTAILEGLLTPELIWRPASLVTALVAVFSLLWWRTAPAAASVVAFGTIGAVQLTANLQGIEWPGLFTTACVLLLPYSLVRWASGREIVIGLVVPLVSASLSIIGDATGPGEAIGAFLILLTPAVIGASARYRATAHARELDGIKLREREQLARELHDTVAHHVSAIAIQAQAGRTLASSRPSAAVEALAVIEEAASRTLTEMRSIVSALRNGEEADLTPLLGVGDIPRLATSSADRPTIEVELSGDLRGLPPSIDTALYRLAQESITNAMRHARNATKIEVRVVGGDDDVRLSVSDDGTASPFGSGATGFGLVGMTERAAILGGSVDAGPSGRAGWVVEAVLPRGGKPA